MQNLFLFIHINFWESPPTSRLSAFSGWLNHIKVQLIFFSSSCEIKFQFLFFGVWTQIWHSDLFIPPNSVDQVRIERYHKQCSNMNFLHVKYCHVCFLWRWQGNFATGHTTKSILGRYRLLLYALFGWYILITEELSSFYLLTTLSGESAQYKYFFWRSFQTRICIQYIYISK